MKWFDEEITSTEANEKCQSFGAYLPTFIDDDTGRYLYYQNSALQWIGYSDQHREGEWVDHLGNPDIYLQWAGGQPDNHLGIQDCAVLNWGGAYQVDDQRFII